MQILREYANSTHATLGLENCSPFVMCYKLLCCSSKMHISFNKSCCLKKHSTDFTPRSACENIFIMCSVTLDELQQGFYFTENVCML